MPTSNNYNIRDVLYLECWSFFIKWVFKVFYSTTGWFFLIKWYLYFVNKKEIDKSPISNFDIKIERFSYAYKDCNILTFGRWG